MSDTIPSLSCQIFVTSLFEVLQEKQNTVYNFYLLFLSPFYEPCQKGCQWKIIFGYLWGQPSDSCQIETYDVLTRNKNPKIRRFAHVFLKQLIKMLLLCNWFSILMGKNSLGTHRIWFGLKKIFRMCRIIVIYSVWIVKTGI